MMKGIQILEELCRRDDIDDVNKWINRAINELKPEGLEASSALAQLIRELVDCRNPNLPYIFIVAPELEPTKELVDIIHSIISTHRLAPRPSKYRFPSGVSEGNLVGWTDQMTEGIKYGADFTLGALIKKQEKQKNKEKLDGRNEQKQEVRDRCGLEKTPKQLEKSKKIQQDIKPPSTKEDNFEVSLKANKKIVEERVCKICNNNFSLGEDIKKCEICSSFFHIKCWNVYGDCNQHSHKENIKNCPMCGEVIKEIAIKCRYCGEYLDKRFQPVQIVKVHLKEASEALAFAIGGIFCLGYVLGPIAIYKGIKAVNIINNEPGFEGKGKAIAGIIIGSVVSLLNFLGILGFFKI